MPENRANILVVDDNPENLRTLSAILYSEGYKVRKATNGTMALATIRSQQPDLILLDIRMPKIDGFEVCTTLQQQPQTAEIPIIFISASDETADKVKAFESGGADYITKPFRVQEVLARINHQLTLRRQHQQLAELYQQVQHLNANLEQQVQERTRELQQALEKLQQLNQLKDDFLSTVSHELRTPIANIHMVLQLLMAATHRGQDFFKKLSETELANAPSNKITQYLDILQEECDRELHLIQDLLDLQQLNADTRPIKLASIDLYDWIPHVLEVFENRMQKKQQTLKVQLAPDLPSLITDPSSLNRILSELLNNACKYTPVGETVTVTVNLTREDQEISEWDGGANTRCGSSTDEEREKNLKLISFPFLLISITNTGIEIPASELPCIFNKFYRIPSHDPWKHGGTGLGLALIKKLVEQLQGSIRVTSLNNLTCFTVKLPLRQAIESRASQCPVVY